MIVGLVITLAAVLVDAWYMTTEISRLRILQTDLADRNRIEKEETYFNLALTNAHGPPNGGPKDQSP